VFFLCGACCFLSVVYICYIPVVSKDVESSKSVPSDILRDMSVVTDAACCHIVQNFTRVTRNEIIDNECLSLQTVAVVVVWVVNII